MRTHTLLIAPLLLALFTASLPAQTSYPMITHATPVAVQRGKTTSLVVEGQMNFHGAYKVLFEPGSKLTAVVPGPPPAKVAPNQVPTVRNVKIDVTVPADAPLGVAEFRLATTLGLSSIGQLVVVDDPVTQEAGDNNTRGKANPLVLPGVVSGRIEAAEDVDWFKFHAEAGQTVTFEVYCARLQDKIHDLQKHADPLLALFDADGRELAANDDFYFADPLLSYTIAKTGDYYVQVRDSKYDGDPRWAYALLATNRPHVTHVFPMAANPGQTLDVEPVGSAALVKKRIALTAPREIGVQQVQLDVGGVLTTPTAFIVSPLPQVVEQEPNDTPEQATPIPIPAGVNGRIGKPRDLDYYRFKATKGKAIRFEIKARRFGTRLQSSLDAVLEVLDAKGAVLAQNDDTYSKDPALVFTPSADSEYLLRVRDLNSKGGPTAVYYLEADWAVQDFVLRCDPDKAMLGPGSSTAWYVLAERFNGFAGPITVEVKDLPRGVTASPLTIPATMTQGVVVLTAASDAPREASNARIEGKATLQLPGKDGALAPTPVVRTVIPTQEIYFPGGGRGTFDVNLQSVAVTDAADIAKVEVTPKEINLKPGEEVRLEVTVERGGGYDKGVSLDVVLQHLGRVFASPLPPGVTIDLNKSKTLVGTGNKGHIVLKAAPNAAPIENVPLCVLAHVSINFVVKISYSSAPIMLNVRR
jgi:hypothetical protein